MTDSTRSFGATSLTLTGVGTVIGAGIFVITGQAAAALAGPAIALSFVIACIVCVFSALCYAEMAAMIPDKGSGYSYTKAAFGPRIGWIIGWALFAEYLFAMSAIAIGWSAYMQGVVGGFGVKLPAALASSPLAMTGQSFSATGAIINLPAVLIIAAVTWSHLSGVKESARFNLATVWIKLSAVFLFIGFGLAHADPSLWTPFIPPVETHPDGSTAYGIPGMLQAAGMVFFAYLGFDALATAAHETRDPQRNLPIAILGTLGISTLLYILVSMAMTGLADFRTLGSDAPITTALAAVPDLAWLKTYVGVAVTIGLWAALWPCVFAVSRLLMVFSDDGFLPASVSAYTPAGIPKTALLTAGGLGAVIAGVFPIALLGELISTGTLLAFATVCAAVIHLRRTQPERSRPFRVPLWPVVATLGIASALFLLASMGWYAVARIAAWQAIGVGILLIVSQRRRAAA